LELRPDDSAADWADRKKISIIHRITGIQAAILVEVFFITVSLHLILNTRDSGNLNYRCVIWLLCPVVAYDEEAKHLS